MPYLCLRFEKAVVDSLKHLGLLSQLDPAAGLGCHPFHVTLFAGVKVQHVPPPVAAIADSLAAIAACVPPFPLLASDGVLGAVEGRKVVARFYGGAALLSHKQAVGAVKQGLVGKAFDPAYGGQEPNVHVTLGTLAAGASAAALQEH